MEPEKRHEIQQWLLKSRRDLASAKWLLTRQISLLDAVVYHCQQSTEKALKAYLTYQDVIFHKTHNLGLLLDLCCDFEADFDDLRQVAETLTPYATEFRYPGDLLEPERLEAEEAIEMAAVALVVVTQNYRMMLRAIESSGLIKPAHWMSAADGWLSPPSGKPSKPTRNLRLTRAFSTNSSSPSPRMGIRGG